MLEALIPSRSSRTPLWPARLALGMAFVFLAWKAVELLWLSIAGPRWPEPAMPPALPPQQAAPALSQGQVAQWHLFGDTQGGVDLAALAQARAPETTLRLTLRGTFNETSPDAGIAIVADEQGVDRAYRVGDALPGDARLQAIYAGHVTLIRAGVTETLSLRVTDTAPATPQPRATAGRTAALPGSTPAGIGPFTVAPVIAPGAPDMQSYRNANLPNVQELAKQVQVFPVFDNGRMRGVRLGVGRDSDLLGRAGLKPTDIVTAVNGIPLDGPARQADLLASLRDARQVQVDVERDGKTLKLQLGL